MGENSLHELSPVIPRWEELCYSMFIKFLTEMINWSFQFDNSSVEGVFDLINEEFEESLKIGALLMRMVRIIE